MLDRRRFLLTSLGGAFSAPFAAEAQQVGKIARIGYLQGSVSASPQLPAAFHQGLRDLGYVEGRDVVIEYRDAGGKLDRLSALATELVALKVDVIVATNTRAAIAAKQATNTIPIVFASPADPVTSKLVTSLARPGGNVTGVSSQAPEVVGKGLELLKMALPGVTRVAAVWHRDYGERTQTDLLSEADVAAGRVPKHVEKSGRVLR